MVFFYFSVLPNPMDLVRKKKDRKKDEIDILLYRQIYRERERELLYITYIQHANMYIVHIYMYAIQIDIHIPKDFIFCCF